MIGTHPWGRLFVVSVCFGLVLAGSSPSYAREQDTYQYPELVVTPSASQRLYIEAKSENTTAWTNHLALQGSALLTLVAGVLARHDPGSRDTNPGEQPRSYYAGLAGMAIGGGWLAVSTVMAATYRPYASGRLAIKNLSTKTKRDRLFRERLAEEHLLEPAALGTRMKWLAAATNFLAAGLIVAESKNEMTQLVGGLAGMAAIAPFLFPSHWEEIGDYHLEYKKKIYGPLANVSISFDHSEGRLRPMAYWSLSL